MDRLRAAWGQLAARPRVAALFLGATAATGFPPLHLWPLALLGMAGLVGLLREVGGWRRAFLIGWLFGAAHFTFTNSWIATAFTYQAEMPAALGWVAVPLVALYLAVYPALAAAAAFVLGGRRPLPLAFAFAAAWIVAEWLRSWIFTGYAWGPFGLILLGPFDRPGVAALLPWLGTYGLSGLAALIAAGLALLLGARQWLRAAAVFVLLGIGMYLPAGRGQEGKLAFTVVQPDIRQSQLDDPRFYEEHFQRLARLSAPRKAGERRIVLWPESGVPDYLREGYPQRYYLQTTAAADPRYARWRLGRAIGPGSLLLTGAVDLEIENGRAVGAYNAVTAVAADGSLVGSYAKAHLVPYGEYLALRWLLEPLGATRLVAGSIDFIEGPGPRTLALGAYGNVGMQICYEIIFSGQVVDPENRPDFIFNPSNDGWFGAFGPPQHLAQARLRAIEEGLPVLRATTTGISAVIDARGVVREHLGMHRVGRIDGAVPPAEPPTLFARLGNSLPLGWALVLMALSFLASRRRHG